MAPAAIRSVPRMAQFLAALLLVSVVVALTAAMLTPARYHATATLFVSETETTTQDLGHPDQFLSDVRASYAQVATTPIVLRAVLQRLHLSMSVADLAREVSTEQPTDTQLIRIVVSDGSATRSASIANAVADRLEGVAQQLQPSGAQSKVHLTEVRRACLPSVPEPPMWFLLLGAGVGAAAAVAVLFSTIRRRGGEADPLTAPSDL